MQRGVGAVAGIAEGGGGNCAIMMQNYHHRHRRRRRLHHQQQQAPLFSASLYAPSLSLLSPSIPRRQLTTLLSRTSTSSSSKFFDNSSCRLQFGGPAAVAQLRKRRRQFVSESIAAGALLMCTAAAMADTAVQEESTISKQALDRLPFKPDGYNFWTWRGHKVHYVVQGQGPPIVLIHGFGASAFHWRYNIPELAKTHTVYAMDLLGFGWSEKALIEYDALLWRDQVADFVKEVVGKPAVLAGNSVGGFTVLTTAAGYPDLVSGLVLLNSSGQFDTPSSPGEGKIGEGSSQQEVIKTEESVLNRLMLKPIKDFVQKYAILFAFWQAKQPARIKSVLQNVYKDQTNVDDYLVQSIVQPTQDANAGEVYYRLMTQLVFKSSNLTINQLLDQLSCPLLLLWGDLDPWMGPSKCEQMKKLYPQAEMVHLQAGHCPHDEAPAQVNTALRSFANSVY
jgi:pimeloyl-ACP methyl ester carboxylesterase